ncbi:MAG TPA: P1 family peptidase [Burkholderiaceae bacterium]|nr:P1 family peptidase [Burkholderiaceae bacterium]
MTDDTDAGSITAVRGLRVGHFTDPRRPTGCTVLLTPEGAVAGVDVRGAAPGTRETELLSPLNAVEQVHALLLAGGSAFGLDAAGGVMRWLDERGHGIVVGPARVPIVPAAILFDLWVGDASIRPDAAAGYAACDAASGAPVIEGNVGAGAGASVGKLFGIGRAMRGGLGSASVCVDGITVGALVAVNAIGDVVDPASGRPIAGARSADGRALLGTMAALRRGEWPAAPPPAGAATTLGVIATDAVLTKAQANKLAQMAHDGFARAINPVHTMTDGDTIFALGTGASGRTASLTLLGALGADVMARAIVRAVRAATALDAPGLPQLPAARDF